MCLSVASSYGTTAVFFQVTVTIKEYAYELLSQLIGIFRWLRSFGNKTGRWRYVSAFKKNFDGKNQCQKLTTGGMRLKNKTVLLVNLK